MILMLIFIEEIIKVELRGTDFVVPSWRAGSQHVVNLQSYYLYLWLLILLFHFTTSFLPL